METQFFKFPKTNHPYPFALDKERNNFILWKICNDLNFFLWNINTEIYKSEKAAAAVMTRTESFSGPHERNQKATTFFFLNWEWLRKILYFFVQLSFSTTFFSFFFFSYYSHPMSFKWTMPMILQINDLQFFSASYCLVKNSSARLFWNYTSIKKCEN